MSRLPPIKLSKVAPDARAAHLVAWLAERDADLKLAGSDDDAADFGERASGPAPERDAWVEVGQIRLMHPSTAAAWARPVYLAIAERVAGGWCCVPFGRYASPALPGEVRTGLGTACLRVACPWNAGILEEPQLAASWSVGAVGAGDMANLLAVLAFVRTGTAVPAAIRDLTGPPLQHPADPRHAYRDEERELMAGIGAKPICVVREGEASGDELRLAADGRAGYGRELRFQVSGFHLYVHIGAAGERGLCPVVVCDTTGAPSERLDGGTFRSRSGREAGPIWGGAVDISADLIDFGMAISDDSGVSFPLLPAK